MTLDPQRLARKFAARVGHVNRVARVVALLLPDGLSVWTLLDGDTTGQARRAVYDAEFATRRRYPDAPIEFRVIDAAEFPVEHRASLLPADATPLFEREGAAYAAGVPFGHGHHALAAKE